MIYCLKINLNNILACGRGIKLINRKKKLKKNVNYLVSEYI